MKQIYTFSENDDLTPVTSSDPNAPEAFVFLKTFLVYLSVVKPEAEMVSEAPRGRYDQTWKYQGPLSAIKSDEKITSSG